MKRNPDGTISFDSTEIKRKVGNEHVQKDIPVLLSGVTIEEDVGSGTVTYHFTVEYRRERQRKYGYLIPLVKN